MALTGACGCIASTKSSAAGDKLKAKSSGRARMSGGSRFKASRSDPVAWEVPPTPVRKKGTAHERSLPTEQRLNASRLAANNAFSRRTAVSVDTRYSGASCPERCGSACRYSGAGAGVVEHSACGSMDAGDNTAGDCRREVLTSMSRGFLVGGNGCGFFGSTQIGPTLSKVRAQLFTSDSSGGDALDIDASLCGYRPDAVDPLMNHSRRCTNFPGQLSLATDNQRSFLNGFVNHKHERKAMLTQRQAMLITIACSVALWVQK